MSTRPETWQADDREQERAERLADESAEREHRQRGYLGSRTYGEWLYEAVRHAYLDWQGQRELVKIWDEGRRGRRTKRDLVRGEHIAYGKFVGIAVAYEAHTGNARDVAIRDLR